jgi:4-amino-4-deoxy-L-arabinose transferase-like glycosyltransferase
MSPPSSTVDLTVRQGLAVATLAWVVFGVVHMLPRLIPSSLMGAADGLSMVAAQQLQLAYQVGQPPLYDWAVWAVQQVTGPTALGIYLPKYLFCLAAGIYAYLGALAVGGVAIQAVVASVALMLMFNVGMTIHDLSTHSVPMLAAISATFYHFVRVVQTGRTRHYAALGLAIAVGTLSKYGFLIFPAALFLAALFDGSARARLLNVRFLLALLIPVVLVLPFASWVYANREALGARAARTLIAAEGRGHLIRALDGLKDMAGSYLVYASPAVPILWAVWPRLLTLRSRADFGRTDLHALLWRTLAATALLMAVGIALAGLDTMRSRYMHAVALMLPVGVVVLLAAADFSRRRVVVFFAIAAALQVVTAVSRGIIPFAPVRPFCRSCEVIEPVALLAGRLTTEGFAAARIHAGDHQLAGNLRRFLPEAQITTGLITVNHGPLGNRRCAVVTEREAPAAEPGSGRIKKLDVDWPRGLFGPARQTTWFVTEYQPTSPRCRG